MVKNIFVSIENLSEVITGCYRKFKSYVYYTNGVEYMKQQIADFEYDSSMMLNRLSGLTTALFHEDLEYFQLLCKDIGLRVFPKRTKSTSIIDPKLVINGDDTDSVVVEKVNFFIFAPIELYILDTLWTLLLGRLIVDNENNYKAHHAYMFDNFLYDITNPNFQESINFRSLNIYAQYYPNYLKWKNLAVESADELYGLNKDSCIFSLDLSAYFYSASINLDSIVGTLSVSLDVLSAYNQTLFVQQIVDLVYKTYSNKLSCFRVGIASRTIIPIGLVSSGSVANVYLLDFDKKFDNEKVKYYSRYVDDILIVVEKRLLSSKSVDQKRIIVEEFGEVFSQNDTSISICGFQNLLIQESKIKVISILADGSKSIIESLKEEINSPSGPYLLPNISYTLKDFLKSIYFKGKDSLKFRNTEQPEISPKLMMSFFSSYLLGMKATRSEKNDIELDVEIFDQIKKAFTTKTLIDLFSRWPKILSFLLLSNEDSSVFKSVYKKMRTGITHRIAIGFDNSEVVLSQYKKVMTILKFSLREALDVSYNLACAIRFDFLGSEKQKTKTIENSQKYRSSNMIDQKLVSIPLYTFYEVNTQHKNLFKITFEEAHRNITNGLINYDMVRWSPRFINFDEFCVIYNLLHLTDINDLGYFEGCVNKYKEIYSTFGCTSNFEIAPEYPKANTIYKITRIGIKRSRLEEKPDDVYIAMANMNLSKHNMLPHGRLNFEQTPRSRKIELYRLLKDTYYPKFIQKIVKIKQNRYHPQDTYQLSNDEQLAPVHFLVFPEVSIPYDWLSDIAVFSRKSGVAVICGVKYIKSGKRIINSVATILPSRSSGGHRIAYVVLREKNDYSPEEISLIKSNGFTCKPSKKTYNYLFEWRDIRFSIFNCYELTDIVGRSKMKSKIDLLFAIEFNKDKEYFSNIIESSSRDLGCFVAQVNSSQFGDTRIVAPMHSYHRLVASISGGEKDSIHIGKVELDKYNQFIADEDSIEFIKYQKKREHIIKRFDARHSYFKGHLDYAKSSAKVIKS